MDTIRDELNLICEYLSGVDLCNLSLTSTKTQNRVLSIISRDSFLLNRLDSYSFYQKGGFLADREDPIVKLIAARMVLLAEMITRPSSNLESFVEPSSTIGYFTEYYKEYGTKVIQAALSLISKNNPYSTGCSKSILFAISMDTNFAVNLVMNFCSNPLNIYLSNSQYDDYYDRFATQHEEGINKAIASKTYQEFEETNDYKLLNVIGFSPYTIFQDMSCQPFEEYLGDINTQKAVKFIKALFKKDRFFGHYYLTRFFLSPVICKNKETLFQLYKFTVKHKVTDALFYIDNCKKNTIKNDSRFKGEKSFGIPVPGPRSYAPYMILLNIKFYRRVEMSKYYNGYYPTKMNYKGKIKHMDNIESYKMLKNKEEYLKSNNYESMNTLLHVYPHNDMKRWDEKSALFDYILATITDLESCLNSISNYLDTQDINKNKINVNCIARLLAEEDFVFTKRARKKVIENLRSNEGNVEADWIFKY